MAIALTRPCRCGHAKDAHEHYRRGTDCSACACEAFAGRIVLTLALGRHRPVVVVPDEVPGPAEPYVRPTHLAGMPVARPGHESRPRTPLPRRPEQEPSPGRMRTGQGG